MLPKGTTHSFDDSQLINFTIGNAGAVDLNVNGKDAGSAGSIGEVVHLQFGPGGFFTGVNCRVIFQLRQSFSSFDLRGR